MTSSASQRAFGWHPVPSFDHFKMPADESSPLLPSTGQNGRRQSKAFDPLGSSRHLLLGSWINVLLVTVPLCFVAEMLHWTAAARFATSFFAIVPLAKLLGDSTEQLSMRLGQTIGGLLNATWVTSWGDFDFSFGNAVELIVAIAALTQGEFMPTITR